MTIFLAWQVVKTSAVDALVRRNPAAAAAVYPDHPRVQVAIARGAFILYKGRLGEAGRKAAHEALAKAPLIEDPFYFAGVDALAQGDGARGEIRLTEARRRNPRARMPRLILLDRYLRQNRVEDAGREIAVLNRLIPQAAQALVPELARMVREPRTGAALIQVLAHEPALQQAVLAQLASSGADPDLILKVASTSRATSGTPSGLPWQRLLLAKLVEKGDVARAHLLWRSFSGLGGGASEKGLYDGRFAGQPGPPPFNWLLGAGPAGVAERVRGPALEVEYYGRLNAELASQLLILRPGRYTLRFRASGDAKGEGSRLIWSIACLGSAEPLGQIPLRDITSAPRALSASFTVPPGCRAQWLRLTGQFGDVAAAQNATITDMAIEGPAS